MKRTRMLSKFVKKYKELPVQVKASFWFLISAFTQRGVSVITTPIFTRLLSAAEYGQYSVFNSWLGIITVFVSLNLYYGVYGQGLVKFEENRPEFSSSLQGLTITLVATWTVIYLLFRNFWNQIFSLTTVQMLAMLLIIWATAVYSFWASEQRVDFKYKKLVFITIIVSIANPVLGIALILYSEDKVTARILGIALVELIAYTGLFFVQMRRGKKFYSKKFWKYALMFNLPLIPHYLATTILNSLDRIMIGKMVGAKEVGIYNLAYSVSQIMTLFNTALYHTLEPWMYKKLKAGQGKDISKIAYPAFIIIAAANIFLIAFAPEVIAIFAPKSYIDAIWVIPPIAMSVFFTFAYGFFAIYEFFYEKTKYIAIATMAAAILNIVLNYVFINIWGYYAAGYTTLFCYMAYAVCHYAFMKKICRDTLNGEEPYSLKMLLIITLPFMGIGFLFLFTYHYIWLRYGFIMILFILIFIKRKEILKIVNSFIEIKKKKN